MLKTKILNITILNWLLIILIIFISFFRKDKEEFSSTEESTCKAKKPSNSKIKVYNFNTLWCGYSRQFQPIFDDFKSKNKSDNVEIIDVKCDNENNLELCKKYPIPGYPTVLFVEGDRVVEYQGNRTVEDLTKSLQIFQEQ